MASVEVRFSRRAIRNLDALLDYIASQGAPKTAFAYVDRIERHCLELAHFPKVGRPFSSAGGALLRILPFESVMIVYRETGHGVRILAIFDQRQDYRKQLRSLR